MTPAKYSCACLETRPTTRRGTATRAVPAKNVTPLPTPIIFTLVIVEERIEQADWRSNRSHDKKMSDPADVFLSKLCAQSPRRR